MGTEVDDHDGQEEKEKVEAGKIMGGIDASAESNAPVVNGHNGSTEHSTDSPKEPHPKEEPQATSGADTSSPPSVSSPASSTDGLASDGNATPATGTSSLPESPEPSYQATLIQEKKDKLYEQAEAVAAAEEVQMYAGAMADGLDHLGSVGAKAKGMEAGAIAA